MHTSRRLSAARDDREPPTLASYHSIAVVQLKLGLEGLTEQQEGVEEAREEVLIGREVLSERRQSLRQQRARTVNSEVILMDAFRRHYNALEGRVPEALTLAYTALDEERNKLSELENEYLQAEEEQGALEWTLTELETNLYQSSIRQLLDDFDAEDPKASVLGREPPTTRPLRDIPPSQVVQYHLATQELQHLYACFVNLRHQISNRLISATELSVPDTELFDLATQEFVQNFSNLFDQLCHCKARIQGLKSDLMHQDIKPTGSNRCSSEPIPQSSIRNSISQVIHARSDGSTAHLEDDAFVTHRVRDWLLECLRENAVQQIQYRDTLQQTLEHVEALLPDLARWETLANKYWAFDMNDQMHASAAVSHSPSIIHPELIDLAGASWADEEIRGTRSLDAAWREDERPDNTTNGIHQYEGHPDVSDHIGPQETTMGIQHPVHAVARGQAEEECAPRCDSVHNSACSEIDSVAVALTPPGTYEELPKSLNDVTNLSLTAISVPRSELLSNDVVYSKVQWSSALKCSVSYGFGPEDTLVEVICIVTLTNDLDIPWHMSLSSSPKVFDDSLNVREESHVNDAIASAEPALFLRVDIFRDCSRFTQPGFRYVTADQQATFFTRGRVFNVLMAHIDEHDLFHPPQKALQATKPNQKICIHVCRFIIVQNRVTYSQCIPVESKGYYRTIKSSSMLDSCIVYTSEHPPKPRPREHLVKHPIRIKSSKGEHLAPDSRAYFGKTYPVKHNFPVSDVGLVVGQQIYLLQLYCSASCG